MAIYIKVNRNPVMTMHEQGNRAKLIHFVNCSKKDLTRMSVIRLAKNKLNLTHEQASALLWKCLEAKAGYLVEIEQ